MKRLFASLLFAVLFSVAALAQSDFSAGVYYAPNFGKWSAQVFSGNTAAGSQTITVVQNAVSASGGTTFVPFVVNGKVTVGTGSTADTVTISAVGSDCNIGLAAANTNTCTFTATSFSNNHGRGEPIVSADSGSMEAIGYASATGGGQVKFFVDCGIVTLDLGSVTTTSTCFVPNQFFNQGSASRVTTTITTATSWAVGIVNNTSTFSTAQSTLTAGTTSYGVQGTPAVALVSAATSASLTAVLVTAGGGAAGAGKVHVRVWGITAAPPSF